MAAALGKDPTFDEQTVKDAEVLAKDIRPYEGLVEGQLPWKLGETYDGFSKIKNKEEKERVRRACDFLVQRIKDNDEDWTRKLGGSVFSYIGQRRIEMLERIKTVMD